MVSVSSLSGPTHQPTKRLNFPMHLIQRNDDNNIGRVRKEQEMSYELENSCTTNHLRSLSLWAIHIYIQNKQSERNKKLVDNRGDLPNGDKLVGAMFCPISPQINRIRKVITFGCKFL